jgi:uncharacterized protein (DUF433 family)
MAQLESPSLRSLATESSGVRIDEEGVVRIGKSRITLDLVIEQYEIGMAPEDMVRAYDTLDLADVHSAIAFYLRHRSEVAAYLERRKADAETLREKLESRGPLLTRAELLAHRDNSELVDAPAGK